MTIDRERPRRLWRLACALAALLAAGCSTQRTLTIDTNPPGARIWVNGSHLTQRTPVDVPFTHYGRFDVRVEKEGYHAVYRELHVETELDGYPVIDLPLEMMRPERRFRRVIELRPLPARATEADVQGALHRAEAFRARTRKEVAEPGTPEKSAPKELVP